MVRGGQLVVEEPINWPDGTKVRVTADAAVDDIWADTPEGLAAWDKWVNSLEPLIFTDEERAAWEEARAARKEWEKANFAAYSEKLQRLWE